MKDNHGTMTLVELPTHKLSPCILIGENGYEMVSIGKTNSGNINLSDINFEIKPRIHVWESSEDYLWYIPMGMDTPTKDDQLLTNVGLIRIFY